jgi:hypothetical protein
MQNTGETNYFRVYFKGNYTDKPKKHLKHRNPYLTINRDNILLAFSNAETMLRLIFESYGNKARRIKVFFAIKTHQ